MAATGTYFLSPSYPFRIEMIPLDYVVPEYRNQPDKLLDHLRTADHSAAYEYGAEDLTNARALASKRADDAVEIKRRIKLACAGREPTVSQRRDLEAAEAARTEYVALADRLGKASERQNEAAKAEIRRQDAAGEIQWVNGDGSGPVARKTPTGSYADGVPLSREQTFTGYVRSRGLVPAEHENLSLRKCLRGVVLGDWRNADAEKRAMSGSVLSSGGHMIPTILSASVIDKARNSTRVLQAGARLVPMPNRTLDIARWTGDPTPQWHTEAAVISPSDGSMSKLTLQAQTLAGLTVLSKELLEDAEGVEEQLSNALAAQFALTVDKVALYGTGTAPEPRGVKNTSGITTLSMGANGAAITNYDFLVDAVGTLADLNEQATGVIYSPRTARSIGKLKATDNQPMMPPPYIAGIPTFDTNQVPNNLTQGSSNVASDAFTADWSQLYVGVRTEFQVQVLTERYADTGQIGLLTWWRGDIGVARPAAFAVTVGIL